MPVHCAGPGCGKRPNFGAPDTKIALYCKSHKHATDVDVINRRCQAPGCATQPRYGPPGTKIGIYCNTHKRADDVNVACKRCQAPGCATQPTYGPPGTKERIYCNIHKRVDDVDVTNKRCQAPGCATRPNYGPPGAKLGIYCNTHKRADDVDVASKRCQATGCATLSTYGPPGTKERLYCSAHKRADDVDVANKRCQAPGCSTMSTYGPPGSKEKLYCKTHKRTDDVVIASKRCQVAGCTTQPVYGPPGTKGKLYCTAHKRTDDIDLVSKRCQAPGCTTRPNYGPPGTKIGIYCAVHRQADNINVTCKRCQAPGCVTQSIYGIPGTMPDRCHTHIEPGMIVNPRKRCDQCTELGIWGRARAAADRRCDTHRRPDDKNLVEGRCASCGLESVLDKQGTCLTCGEAGKVKRQYLEKQRRAKETIEREFKVESYDKILDGGVCSKKRPDFVIDGTYRKVVVEIDEYQHKRGREYGPDCEYRRMWDIAQALGMPTVFVRYNPDPYAGADGKRCDPAQSEREAALVSWIKTLHSREPPTGGFASALYLYYDGFGRPESAAEEVLANPLEAFGEKRATSLDPTLTDDEVAAMFAEFGLE